MILKILLTLAVLIAVYIWFRTQKAQQLKVNNMAPSRIVAKKTATNTWIKPLVYSIACLSIIAGILIYYLSWVDDHTQYQITITNPQTGSSESYIALKKDMFGRRFITQGGLQINASDLDRIEIKEVDAEDD
ncbi:hypothetical protein A9R00_02160 [Oleispira antarctica]|uniref:Antitermination protein NusG n=1 Tax=Oleispira antarctica TaxID=188908 RepID=A0A1Y5I234_OLEAN|nr:hypothetical protein A9R00_02160 [Oleispira antarctica]